MSYYTIITSIMFQFIEGCKKRESVIGRILKGKVEPTITRE